MKVFFKKEQCVSKPQHDIFDRIGLESEHVNAYLNPGEMLEADACHESNRKLAKRMDVCTDKKLNSEFSTKKSLWCCKEHRTDGALSCIFCLCSECHSVLVLNKPSKENERTKRLRETKTK